MTLCMLLTGCGGSGSVKDLNGCDWVVPIYVGEADDLSPETARDILTHNELWERLCGKR